MFSKINGYLVDTKLKLPKLDHDEIARWAVDILLFIKFCDDHASFKQRKDISRLWHNCARRYFWTGDDNNERLAEVISRLELSLIGKDEEKIFFTMRNLVFPKMGTLRKKLTHEENKETNRLIGYIKNRNIHSETSMFASYKDSSADIIEQIRDLFINKIAAYKEKGRKAIILTFSDKRVLPRKKMNVFTDALYVDPEDPIQNPFAYVDPYPFINYSFAKKELSGALEPDNEALEPDSEALEPDSELLEIMVYEVANIYQNKTMSYWYKFDKDEIIKEIIIELSEHYDITDIDSALSIFYEKFSCSDKQICQQV